MFNRRKIKDLEDKINTLQSKTNAISYKKTDKDESITWNDDINPYMNRLLVKGQTDVKNVNHRSAQSRYNINANKHTFGVAEKLLSKRPYPFSFAEPYSRETENDANEETDTEQGLEGDNKEHIPEKQEPQPKSNGASSQNQLNEQGTNPFGGGGLFGQDTAKEEEYKYEIKEEMDELYPKWKEANAFYLLEQAIGISLAVGTSAICRTSDGQYWVFGQEQFEKVKGKNRLITKIKVKWTPVDSRYEEEKTLSNINKMQKTGANDYFIVGKDCVLVQPFPWAYDIFGFSSIMPNWDLLINKLYLRFLHLLYIWKGGIISKYNRYPNNTEDDVKKRIELDAKRGWLSEGINMDFPPGLDPANIDKMFDHQEVLGQDINFDEANSIFSQDSPYPKMMVEGQVESGALGGSAPEVDQEELDKQINRMFRIIEKPVMDMNATFFDYKDTDYIVIPWQNDKSAQDVEMDGLQTDMDRTGMERTIEDNKTPPKEDKAQKTNSLVAKINSVNAQGLTVYQGNLFSHKYLQDDGSYQYLEADEIKKYIDNPLSLKEGLMQIEHPEKADRVLLGDAVAKYKIIGFDKETGLDITEFYIDSKNAPQEIDVSSMYFSEDVKKEDKVFHTNIDLRNAVFTSRPRSEGSTKAKKK